MVRKAVDSRINTLIKNGVQQNHRSFFVLVGDKGKDQIVNLHWMLSQARVSGRPSVLWCYKKDLGFTTHRKKREAKIKREIKKGIRETNQEDPFEMFITMTDIRYTYYKESHKILGNTYGMCVLQDFEALTPNILARTIETVEGGGIVVLLLKTMKSLKQLYTMTMDVHARYRTEVHGDVVARFNERFILSLADNKSCLVLDDELNVLPISLGKSVKPLPPKKGGEMSPREQELASLKSSLADTQPIGNLIARAKTLDQAKAIMTFIDAISDKTLRTTVSLTAGRGRGKSAALGIALAGAIAYGYSNIFVTSPSPENLKTLFQFIFKGFDALGFEEHIDYDIVQSTNPDFRDAIVRVNVFRKHRQTIQYIQPQDAYTLAQAELVVIDEAAAIPLPLVKKLIGPYLVFMASTINGYEGTGRSLSLKLIQQLREQSRGFVSSLASGSTSAGSGGRSLKEVTLEEPIRYSIGDSTEQWLNKLLCLDATIMPKTVGGCPHPSECELYWINRDSLFSYHPVSEAFLQRLMALFVASHYKNSPNDLQLMSDAPAHQIFVLLPPIAPNATTLPEPLSVIQVSLEGEISRQAVINTLGRGERNEGDLIPWLISQQYQDSDFASLSGARVVRIATHPDYASMGYGSRALEQLREFYEGKFYSLQEPDTEGVKSTLADSDEQGLQRITDEELEQTDLHHDMVDIRDPKAMPPLFLRLPEKKPTRLHWLGVSYGLTQSLHKFWKRSGYSPVYMRQTSNELTGEYTCVMLNELSSQDLAVQAKMHWLDAFVRDFHRRFCTLLSFSFKEFTAVLAMSILDSARAGRSEESLAEDSARVYNRTDLARDFSSYDLKRLESYANNLLDYHVVLDMLPAIAQHYFSSRFGAGVSLSGVQACILLGVGLQRKSVDAVEKELNLPSRQILALFTKILRKFSNYFRDLETKAIEAEIETERKGIDSKMDFSGSDDEGSRIIRASAKRSLTDEAAWDPTLKSLEDDLEDAGKEVTDEFKQKQRELIDAIDLSEFAIADNKQDWDAAEGQIKKAIKSSGSIQTVVSVKNPTSSKKAKKERSVVKELVKSEEARAQKNKKAKTSKKTSKF
ncbi:N-acetyltransferase 10 [Coemansia spiralis]|uniref:RNA cytidine acetyltransferase n=2 Tax=Coemansia TaxID=4863 RepID=A0A9W8FYA7_9FUNG|nr:N-acetyltransferase 10 [Coemansia umbellata]KAJ2619420.1 N-acetyltransferase 10 [Coemansia sp. RSA 1358]KAJ2671022.1 N-acetyltransferase 10 [Coemansia spiralis]